MAMRINHNLSAMTALRHLGSTSDATSKSLERLSSGMKVNTAADGPAALVISERMRAQLAGLDQAIANSETSISMVQTAEGALNEVSGILVTLRQLALHASNEGTNDSQMLQADQSEIENLLISLDRIADQTQFGSKTLLDGSNGASGAAVGDGLHFITASPSTEPTPSGGLDVDITQVATRTTARGEVLIGPRNVKQGIRFIIAEGGRNAVLDTNIGELKEDIDKMVSNFESNPVRFTEEEVGHSIRTMIAGRLQDSADEAGIDVDVMVDPMGMLTVRHREFGSKHKLTVTSSLDGVLSQRANVAAEAAPGLDVAGTIGGYTSIGDGQMLEGMEGTPVEGLVVQYANTLDHKVEEITNDAGDIVGKRYVPQRNDDLVGFGSDGYVHVTQNALAYQVGPNEGQQVKISLGNVRANSLSQDIENKSEFNSLADIDVTTNAGAQDSILLIDEAIEEISGIRAELGSFQKNALESNLNSLKVASENLTNAESIIRDADMAAEMSNFTKNQIMMSSGTAMAAQANQVPRSVLQLLNSASG